MSLWSDFLRRLMVTATLSGPATAAAEPPAEPPADPPAEMGEPSPVATLRGETADATQDAG